MSSPLQPSGPRPADPAALPSAPPFSPWQEWPILLVVAIAALGVAVTVLVGFRPGCIVVGAAVLLAGLLRLVLPARNAGMLVIRGKGLDLLTMLGLGTALVVAAVVVPAHLVQPGAGVGTVGTGTVGTGTVGTGTVPTSPTIEVPSTR